MNSDLIKRPVRAKTFLLAAVFTIMVWTLLQFDLPTAGGLEEYLSQALLERQLQGQNQTREDSLRQGWLFYSLGQYEKAEKIMKGINREEQIISALYCLGLIDIIYGRYDQAVQRLQIVAAKSPRHVQTKIALGKSYYHLRYLGLAGKNLEQAVALEPDNEEARLWLGKTYIKQGKRELARSMLMSVTHGGQSLEAAALLKNLPE